MAPIRGGLNAAHRLICIACVCSTLLVVGCSVQGQAKYSPPFVPVEFAIDTQGRISVQAGSATIATPIGDFSVGVSAEQDLNAPAGGMLVFIRRLFGGQPTDAAYNLHEASADMLLVIDDDITIHFSGKILSIDAKQHHTIVVTTPQAYKAYTTYCTLPPLDPQATQNISDVRFTTTFTDWQTGVLEPQDNVSSFALKQPIIQALFLRTNSAGTLTVTQKFCSDGHDVPFCDDFSVSIPAGNAGTWYSPGSLVYSTACPQDVGPAMITYRWNGAVVYVGIVTYEPINVAYSCPAPPVTGASGFALSNLHVAADPVSQRGTSDAYLDYGADASGLLEAFLCVDGTTTPVNWRQVGPGSASGVHIGTYNMQNPNNQCEGCEMFGQARWIVVWNHHVVGQIPFTVTE
jgi:hypothetical protein